MISNDYYKYTTNIAYPIDDWRIDGSTIKAVIQMKDGEDYLHDILDKNDFYAIKNFFNSNDVINGSFNMDDLKFEITFVYNSNHYEVCDIIVGGTIDCTFVEGGEFVIVCEGIKNIETHYDEQENNNEDKTTPMNKSDSSRQTSFFNYDYYPFKMFDNLFGISHDDGIINNISKYFDNLKNSGSKFYEVSYSLDSNGNGHYRKVDNNGVVEKHFKKVDGKMKEITHDCNCNNCTNCNCKD